MAFPLLPAGARARQRLAQTMKKRSKDSGKKIKLQDLPAPRRRLSELFSSPRGQLTAGEPGTAIIGVYSIQEWHTQTHPKW